MIATRYRRPKLTSVRIRADRRKTRLSLSLSFGFALIPTQLLAQAAVQLEDVTVNTGAATANKQTATGPIDGYVPRVSSTGTKTATPLIETPQSISVVGAEQIRDQNAQSVVEALRFSSGVLTQTFGNDTRNDFLLIRGLPAQQSGYFLDGLQLASPGFATFRVEPFNLERIEILKGPASVLYGGSNTGGILNMVSKRPSDTPFGYIEAGIDNFGNAFTHFDVGGPVGTSKQWSYRVEGVARGGGTQTDFTPDDRLSIAPSLTYAPDAATSITVLGSYLKDRTRGQNFLPYFGTVQNAPFGKISTSLFTSDPNYDTFQRNQALIGYSADHTFNDVFSIHQNLRYSDLRITDQTLFGNGYADGDTTGASGTLARINFATYPHLTEFAVDTHGEAKFTTGPVSHIALLGVDYKRFDLYDNEAFAFGDPFNFNLLRPAYAGATVPTPFNIVNNNIQDQVGVYLQEQAKLDHFTLVLSGRHDSLQTTLDNRTAPSFTQSADDAFTGRVGLIYTSDKGIAPYATLATSFDPQLGTNSSGGLLAPMRGRLAEVGVKYQPIATNLSFTAALFDIVQTNVLTTDPNFVLASVQTGAERSRGFELEAQGNLTDGLKILAAYSGFDVRVTRNDLAPALIGKTPTGVPQNFGSAFIDYTLQDTMFRGLGAGIGVRYTGGSFASTDNTFGVQSFVLGDFRVHYEREHWLGELNVTNFTDRTYVSTCSSTSACFYGERLKATARIAYRW